jgi:hypothetical protein
MEDSQLGDTSGTCTHTQTQKVNNPFPLTSNQPRRKATYPTPATSPGWTPSPARQPSEETSCLLFGVYRSGKSKKTEQNSQGNTNTLELTQREKTDGRKKKGLWWIDDVFKCKKQPRKELRPTSSRSVTARPVKKNFESPLIPAPTAGAWRKSRDKTPGGCRSL